MRDTIITRKPFLPHRRRTDMVLFTVCFLFLLFSAFIVSPLRSGSESQVPGKAATSAERPIETCMNEDSSARTALYGGEPFLIAGRSDLNDERMTTRR